MQIRLFLFYMLDRKTPPLYFPINNIKLAPIKSQIITEDINFYSLQNPSLNVFRLELVFRAGSYFGDSFAHSYFVSQLISSGTSKFNSQEIAEKFESLGAHIECSQGPEWFIISLFGISQYFEDSLQLLHACIYEANFPENDFEIIKAKNIQGYRINLEKTNVQCNLKFKENIFSKNHKLGQSLDPETINGISRAELRNFHEKYVTQSAFNIFLTGNFNENNVKELIKTFKKENLQKNTENISLSAENEAFKIREIKSEAVQCSIKLGNKSINRTHPDFFKMMVFNTVFGGYFGSRLMKNIREEKGLTYGISSGLSPIGKEWIWAISSDVKKANVDIVIEEIDKELNVLRNTAPSHEELETVKNYMSGSLLNGTVSVFEIMDKHRLIIQDNLKADFYENFIPNIRAVSQEDVIAMAKKYTQGLSSCIIG